MTINFGTNGAVPTPPAQLLSTLIAGVVATNPGYTADLPGLLIEDITSTCVAALVTIDQASIDTINSITPYSANPFVLQQLGAQSGIILGANVNTSAYVVFTGTAGYVIPSGFQVSDGAYTYQLIDPVTIQSTGTTQPAYVVALLSGTWAVPANSITRLFTSAPAGYITGVTNPLPGVPAQAAESVASYRSRVINAQSNTVQGTGSFLISALKNIPGVVPRLVNVLQVSNGWEVLCGGGDPDAVAGAIYNSVLDLSTIVGSLTTARNITASITDYPNSYNVTYVNPPLQTVTGSITWNTTLANFANAATVNQLGQIALANYINSISVGQPINEFDLTAAFQQATASSLPTEYLTRLVISISINGVVTAPVAGTGEIPGDPESYFQAQNNAFSVAQG